MAFKKKKSCGKYLAGKRAGQQAGVASYNARHVSERLAGGRG